MRKTVPLFAIDVDLDYKFKKVKSTVSKVMFFDQYWGASLLIKNLLVFKCPSVSTACFIFNVYPMTKDTLNPFLDYIGMNVSS